MRMSRIHCAIPVSFLLIATTVLDSTRFSRPPHSRKPILRLPRELPIAEQPADVYATSERDHAALRGSTYPKLLFYGDPGALVSPVAAKAFASTLHNCRLVDLGAGAHYLQEDHPEVIGKVIRDWVVEITATAPQGVADP